MIQQKKYLKYVLRWYMCKSIENVWKNIGPLEWNEIETTLGKKS